MQLTYFVFHSSYLPFYNMYALRFMSSMLNFFICVLQDKFQDCQIAIRD